eukprot:gene30687-65348_t
MFLLSGPANTVLFRGMTKPVKEVAKLKDRRLKTVTELFQGIRAVKCMTWEGRFAEEISRARADEIAQLRILHVFRVLFFAVMIATAPALNFACFVIRWSNGGALAAPPRRSAAAPRAAAQRCAAHGRAPPKLQNR